MPCLRARLFGPTLLVLLAAVPFFTTASASAAAPREVVSLDDGWRFHRGDVADAAPGNPADVAYDDKDWRKVDVPHDYIVEGVFDQKADKGHGFLPITPAWYRKTIALPAAAKGRRLWLEFDGVFSNSRYWLNGREIGSHRSGYTSFRFDITDCVKPGEENVLAVRVDPVFEGWWYEGGGIYRHVRLVSVDPVHVAPWGVFVSAAVSDPKDSRQADAEVAVKTALENASAAAVDAVVLSEVLDAEGKVVARHEAAQAIPANGKAEAAQRMPLSKANLWSIETPYLYKLRTTISVAGKPVDQSVTNFGARHLRFNPDKGFFLNGKHVKIQGVCCHQDHAGVGVAMPDRLQVWRIERLKEMGCNGYRCSHNPPAPEVLDACDRLGMLVMDENRHLGDTWDKRTRPGPNAVEHIDLTAMVLRDRNHPSIVMWSMCNEEPLQGTPEGAALLKAMKDRTNQLDGTRPVLAAMNGGYGAKGGFTEVTDIEGFNYHPKDYAAHHKAFPKQPIIGSETASEVGTRGIYATDRWDRYTGDKERHYVAAYGLNAPPWAQTAENAWRPIAENDYIIGGFVWTGFDYKGEPTPFGWPCVNSHFGILDICGFPKDSYYYYQAWWTDKPVLHIFPHWNWPGKEGQEIDVWCYSNCAKVELFLNGASQGVKEMKPNGHLEWKVKYTPGVLEAKGVYQGKEIAAKVETTDAPAAVLLEPDHTDLTADGHDLAVVAVKILDAKGRLVPVADNEVTFTVTGPAKVLGVGNGNPTSHEPDKAAKRCAFGGLCMVLLQADRTAGPIRLKAEAAGLKPATVQLRAK